jgi:hypothetical protein
MLFMGRGDGTFELKLTTFSGLDGNGICGEAADLNDDGLLDLVFAADPDNTSLATDARRYEDKVYWNTGLHGGKENHWLRLRFAGVSDAGLIGARVLLYEAGRAGEPGAKPLGLRVIAANQSYKSGAALEVHFGLGRTDRADVRVVLPTGKAADFGRLQADRFLTLDLEGGSAVPVGLGPLTGE